MISFTWLLKHILNKIQLCFINDTVLARGRVKPQKFLLIRYLERGRILLTDLCHFQERKMSTHYPDLHLYYHHSLVIESVNYDKYRQANSNLGLFVKTKSLLWLSKKVLSAHRALSCFSFSFLMFVSGFESSGMSLFPVSGHRRKKREQQFCSQRTNDSGIVGE